MVFDDTASSVTVRTRIRVFRMPGALAAIGVPDGVVTGEAAAEGRAAGRAGPMKILKLLNE
jgi:hypothetical protein